AEADELLHLSGKAGVLIQTGRIERFNRAVRAALPYVDGPRFIESDRLAPFNPRGSDVAVVLDLMIHDIDLVRTLVGDCVSDVAAVGVPVLTPSVDIANARLAFADGVVASITASRASRSAWARFAFSSAAAPWRWTGPAVRACSAGSSEAGRSQVSRPQARWHLKRSWAQCLSRRPRESRSSWSSKASSLLSVVRHPYQ